MTVGSGAYTASMSQRDTGTTVCRLSAPASAAQKLAGPAHAPPPDAALPATPPGAAGYRQATEAMRVVAVASRLASDHVSPCRDHGTRNDSRTRNELSRAHSGQSYSTYIYIYYFLARGHSLRSSCKLCISTKPCAACWVLLFYVDQSSLHFVGKGSHSRASIYSGCQRKDSPASLGEKWLSSLFGPPEKVSPARPQMQPALPQ